MTLRSAPDNKRERSGARTAFAKIVAIGSTYRSTTDGPDPAWR